jgi:Berberine and berberine like
MVVFNSKEMTSTIQNFTAGYEGLVEEGLPAALGIQQNVLNTPMGKCFAIGFMWSSPDLDTGRKYLDQIASFGQVIFNGVKETTILEWMDGIAMFAPKVAYGRNCTISLHKLTEEAITVIGREIASMPEDRSTLLSIHQLRGSSEAANTNSVFGARTAHYCLEFIATSSEPERTQAVWDWAVRFRDAMRRTDAQNILTSTYISLTPPTEANAPAIYGDNWEKLVEIKRQYDPKNVFKHALPKFKEMAAKEEQNKPTAAVANQLLHTGARTAFVDPSSVQEKPGSHAEVRECGVISSRDVGLSV